MRNNRRVTGTIIMAVSLAISVLAWSAEATDGDDLHSDNMSLLATLDTAPGGDLAIWGDTAVLSQGSGDDDVTNDGFVIVDISDPAKPVEIGSFSCNGSGADISIWQDLVILSAQAQEGPECDAHAGSINVVDGRENFFGLHFVSIADPRDPELLASINTCPDLLDLEGCGFSHTHTLVPDLDHRDPTTGKRAPRLIVYVNLRNEIVVEVPLRDPAAAHVVGRIDEAPPPNNELFVTSTGGCHDVAVFLPRSLAACAAYSSRQVWIWDISDPVDPSLVSIIDNHTWELAHGTGFSWDGTTLVVADESFENHQLGTCPGPGTSSPHSALWFYDISDARVPVLQGFYQLPQPVETGGCTAHQFNIVPLSSGRDVLVAGWGLGGTTVVDFTDPADPQQIAHYRAAPDDPELRSNPWSSYWYKGFIYANNMSLRFSGFTTSRGFDVFEVDDPRLQQHVRVNRFNFGTQECLPPPHGAAHGSLCEADVTDPIINL